ncbi:FecR family protein [Chitinophaga caeni]|nr:FecR domain-containing protein [Chitinophaga caeni]
MDRNKLMLLLEKFKSGECSEGERMALEQWLSKVGLEKDIEDIQLSKDELDNIKHAAWFHVNAAVKPRFNIRRSIKYAVAAVIFMLIAASVWMWKGMNREETIQWQLVVNDKAGMKKVELPDHSKILMAARTKLYYASSFQLNRIVKVEQGRAFFDIKQDASHPFTVKTGALQTEVLGTSFLLEYNPVLNLHRVSVATGKVRVAGVKERFILNPGERICLRDDHVSEDTVSPGDILSFTSNELILRNASLSELIQLLQLQYQVKVVTNLDTSEGNFTCNVSTALSLEQFLEVLEKVSYKPKIHFKITGDQLVVF